MGDNSQLKIGEQFCNGDDDGILSDSDDDRLDSGADISDVETPDNDDVDQNYVYSRSSRCSQC